MNRFPIDKVMNRILNRAEEHFKDKGVSREQIKEAFYYYFRIAADAMKSFDFPSIVFPKWGTFSASVRKLKYYEQKMQDPELKSRLQESIERIHEETKRKSRKNED